MLKQIILSGTLIVSGTINISSALATEEPTGPAEQIAPTTDNTVKAPPVSIAIINRLPADLPSREMRLPSQALMNEIVDWLSGNFGLPAIYDYPHIAFASPARLAFIRHKEPASNNGRDTGVEHPMATTIQPQDVVALYDKSTQTVFLADDWTGASPAEISVLVHEMVHHLQNMGRLVFACPSAREKLAYEAQELWLRRFGQALESAFGVDRLTILVRSACSF